MSYLQSALYSLRLSVNTIRGRLPRSAAFALIGALFVCTVVALQVGARRGTPTRSEAAPVMAKSAAMMPVTVQAAERAKPFFNFQDGRQVFASFHGAAAQALQSGQASPRALASADFDGNGTTDVV